MFLAAIIGLGIVILGFILRIRQEPRFLHEQAKQSTRPDVSASGARLPIATSSNCWRLPSVWASDISDERQILCA